MAINLKVFYLWLIAVVFYLLGEFCIPVGSFAIPIYFITGSALFFLLLILKKQLLLSKVKYFTKTKWGIFLLAFVVWVFLSIIVSIFGGTFMKGSFFSNFIGNFFNSYLFPVLLSFVAVSTLTSYKKLKKFLYVLIFIVIILGLIEYIGLTFEISFIKDFFSLIVNRSSIVMDKERIFAIAFSNYRISSVFREPGEYAGFLIVTLPIAYYFWKSKIAIFKYKVVNVFFRNLFFIFYLLSIVLTQSPINLVFFLLISLAYFAFKFRTLILKNIKRIICFIVLLFSFGLISLFYFSSLDIENTYLSRINTTLKNISSISGLIYAEQSLGTRICVYEAQIRMGIDRPFFGVGYANTDSKWSDYVLKLPHFITPEVERYALAGKQKGGSAYLWKVISETGFVGAFFLYAFWLCFILYAYKMLKYSFEKSFIRAFLYSTMVYVVFSFYLMFQPIFCVWVGILMGLVYNCYNKGKEYDLC